MPSLPRCSRGRSVLAGCAVVAVALVAAAPARAAGVEVYPPGAKPFGKTYGEWSAEWWKQAVRQTGGPFAPGRVDCAAMGTRKVVFLVGTTADTPSPAERSCRIATHTAILFPPINAECSEVEGNGSTEGRAARVRRGPGRHVHQPPREGRRQAADPPSRFRFVSPLFTFSPVDGNVFGIPPATRSPSVADGYWVMLKDWRRERTRCRSGARRRRSMFSTRTTYELTVR